MDRANLSNEIDTEFQKFLDTKSLREITEQEQAAWTGAVHYVPLQLVVNEASNSTPF